MAARCRDREPGGELREVRYHRGRESALAATGVTMRVVSVVVALTALATMLLAVPAGAATSVGNITVSNQSTTQAGTVEVASTGWRPHSVVSITITFADRVIASATANAAGAVRARVKIPANADVGYYPLAVNGSTPSGIPQQIVTGLSVVSTRPVPKPTRPWTIVCIFAALAALVLLACQRVDNVDRAESRLAVN